MMTIHKIHQPSSAMAIWTTGVAALAAVLTIGVVTLGEASARHYEATTSTQVLAANQEQARTANIADACKGVIFRDEDPLCFEVRKPDWTAPAQLKLIGTASPEGQSAGS
jgi:hypothetical protein